MYREHAGAHRTLAFMACVGNVKRPAADAAARAQLPNRLGMLSAPRLASPRGSADYGRRSTHQSRERSRRRTVGGRPAPFRPGFPRTPRAGPARADLSAGARLRTVPRQDARARLKGGDPRPLPCSPSPLHGTYPSLWGPFFAHYGPLLAAAVRLWVVWVGRRRRARSCGGKHIRRIFRRRCPHRIPRCPSPPPPSTQGPTWPFSAAGPPIGPQGAWRAGGGMLRPGTPREKIP
eukprot:scaffold2131_cov384-Prasinococcus_capsulatus_cf.AAC.8